MRILSCCQPSNKIESGLVHDAGRVAASVPPLPVPGAAKEFGGTLQSLDNAMKEVSPVAFLAYQSRKFLEATTVRSVLLGSH